MSLIKTTFERLKAENKTALIPYITAGDFSKTLTVPMMHALVSAGADIIELGVPFSDPMADGPAIQLACERALVHKTGMEDVMQMVEMFRQDNTSTPVVLMGYLNPIEVLGYDVFAQRAAKAGVNGVLTVDMPPEEAERLVSQLKPHNIDPIFLLAPTSTVERIQSITKVASGFVYYVSLKGVTGAATLDTQEVEDKISLIRQYTNLPLGIGFGIRDAQTAKVMAKCGDAVVVGSALVNKIGECKGNENKAISEVSAIISSMKSAIDSI